MKNQPGDVSQSETKKYFKRITVLLNMQPRPFRGVTISYDTVEFRMRVGRLHSEHSFFFD